MRWSARKDSGEALTGARAGWVIKPRNRVNFRAPTPERGDNEDSCTGYRENDQRGLVAVADGVSSYDGGEVASQRAMEVLVCSFTEQGPGVATMKRLVRAIQQANIDICDTAGCRALMRERISPIGPLRVRQVNMRAP